VSDFVPDLDDIAFDQLVEQARAAIPRYAPAWTDHNLHDPGMTLIDLLAWIVDQQVYRAGSVGGRYQAAFAALLGRHPSDPVAAAGLVWPDGPLPDGRLIPARTAAVCLTHRELSFEVDHEQLYLPAVTLTGLRDEHGTDVPLDGGSWTAGPEFSLVFDGPLSAGTPTGTTTRVSLGFDVVPPSGAAVTGDDPPWGPVRYLYQAGDSGWRDVCVLRDDTYGLAATGVVELAIPRRPAGPGGSELRLSLRRGFYPLRPQIRGVAVNVLRVRQIGRTAKEQYAPDGGRPDRLIPLDTTGLVEPVTITVDGVPWERRADLSRSGPADGHFLVRPDGIQFGNGVNGKIPPVKVVVERGPLARTEGTAGNLRSGLRWTVPVLKIDVYGRNRQAVSGGQDAGGDLAAAARDAAVQRSALLTDAELVTAASGLPGLPVRRAEAIAGFDRRLPDRRVEGVRTLVVVSTEPGEIATRLEPRRVLGERLVVEEPVVVTVDLALSLTVELGSVDVPKLVKKHLQDRLSLDHGALGRELTTADVVAMTVAVPGVVDVPTVRMSRPGEPPGDGPIAPPRDGLIVVGEITFGAGG